ncbi:MAG: sulfate reduction electron transfer complex DsrMKJOP subunit DsrJ [Desulfovibrio sp.]|nr:sulfate reduction electron transfer complex DsrMKJOP subunit DsrJ [Desulfovibrio sp.]
MYNAKYIMPGLVIFLGLITFPLWFNVLSCTRYEAPQLALPEDQQECIIDAKVMRAEHMTLLNDWRDKYVRDGEITFTAANGKIYDMSLMNTCMSCHTNKEQFCDSCHTKNSVYPYCWECHIAPRGNQ